MAHNKKYEIFVNDRWVEPCGGLGAPALDFIRGELGLKGTKEGCREGDCGACAVLVGEVCRPGAAVFSDSAEEGRYYAPRYYAAPSCLLALGDLCGKHLITIEGLAASAPEGLTPVMRAFLEENASQCGFCSPGFVVALSAWLTEPDRADLAGAMKAVDGNLCRCTGYGAIRRAAERLAREFADLPLDRGERLEELVRRGVMPSAVLTFAREGGREAAGSGAGLSAAELRAAGSSPAETEGGAAQSGPFRPLGGGSDHYVKQPYPPKDFAPTFLRSLPEFAAVKKVSFEGKPWIKIGAALSVRDFFASPLLREAVPGIEAYEELFASTLIRNIATVGGNIANASPVADISPMLIALGALLEIGAPGAKPSLRRSLPVERFFTGYKTTALRPHEVICAVLVPYRPGLLFSFEKIAKRGSLDIAAVNSAMAFHIENGCIRGARISAGGVAPLPALLKSASASIEGARVEGKSAAALAELARRAAAAAEKEISPISDLRGSAAYRRRMAGRLLFAHFIRLFAGKELAKELFP